VFLEPGVTKDDVLLPEPSDSELDSLSLPFVVDHHIDYAGDATHLVWTAIHVEDWDGLQKALDWKVAGDDILRVNEVSSHSAVDQSLHRHPHGGLDRLQVQRDVQGVLALDEVDDILLGKLPFLLWAVNMLE
jgi:hypothetical protein